ncbi:ATP-binding protein [Longimicrobium terrae]|uniref:histidine kinase n=1 Tax=Longimicrobium terrae TaxID=1639882 RepID=A0A841H4P6_9BACT|nr:ATP-binding protein [Longimicrobium terrae]MBB4638798.1 signal transduction histidine kinase [Longimicrobium terrae]MBB6073037.1 signal transduction histidine kinase [Longimicrobium terrae]NNC33160.1 histidine kinase [Longimicrobium terrae]
MSALLAVSIARDTDVVPARQRARQMALLLGMDAQDAVRIATAVSEIARNAWEYAGGGRVEFAVAGEPGAQRLEVTVSDRGPGIPHLDAVLAGTWRSAGGMGVGLAGAHRLVDRVTVDTAPGRGTRVTLARALPPGAPLVDAAAASRLAEQLARERPADPADEVRRQNQELLGALAALRERQEEMERLNGELEDTNRGVVALYTELEEQAEQLRRANRLQAQFLSYVSHEFRTPLDAMLALTELLLNRVDGPLTAEQETQVGFVRTSAADLLQMVDELLDAARMEAGQVEVRPAPFSADDLFSALRATFRPLHARREVALVFEDAAGVPELHTDEGKVSQVLRNLISNALKFTRAGEVRVSVHTSEPGWAAFRVADTGIGIPEAERHRIFQDFAQVESPLQRGARGTGLGLALSRRFALLLGGTLEVDSTPAVGSVFTLRIPLRFAGTPPSEAPHAIV